MTHFFSKPVAFQILLGVSIFIVQPVVSEGGCPCENGNASGYSDNAYTTGVGTDSSTVYSGDRFSNAYTNTRAYNSQPANTTTVPPPGNLGVTYRRPSRLVAWDQHPRAAMLEIALPESVTEGTVKEGEGLQVRVTVQDHRNYFEPLEGHIGDDDRWVFESDPLIPGIPHIYNIKVALVRVRTVKDKRWGRVYETQVEDKVRVIGYRQVRLVRGRILEMNFEE